MTCYYCQGKKEVLLPESNVTITCVDCHGTGQLCNLCGRPQAGDDRCECPPFDPVTSKGRK